MSTIHHDPCIWPWPSTIPVSRSHTDLHLGPLWEHCWWLLFQTSHSYTIWWVLPSRLFSLTLTFKISSFKVTCKFGFRSIVRALLMITHHHESSHAYMPWWALSIGTFVFDLDFQYFQFQGHKQICVYCCNWYCVHFNNCPRFTIWPYCL